MMDHKTLIPQFVSEAVNETFTSVFHPASVSSSDDGIYGVEGIFSTIYLKGHLVGKASIFIKTQYGARVVAQMLGVEELQDDSHEVMDGIGEVLNMITGCVKKRLEPHHFNIELSVPSTRLTSVIPPSRWEYVVEQNFDSADTRFKVILSYRIAAREESAPPPPPKPKLSAAELLKMAMAKKK